MKKMINWKALAWSGVVGVLILGGIAIGLFGNRPDSSDRQRKEAAKTPVAIPPALPETFSSASTDVPGTENRPGERETASSGLVDLVVKPNGENTWQERLRFVHELPYSLSETECGKLLDFLANGPNAPEEYAIKNDIINVLRNQKQHPAGLTETLLELSGTQGGDIVVRSYAAQHLRPWFEETKDVRIKEHYRQLLSEEPNEVAGCALLAVSYLARKYPVEFSPDEVKEDAARIMKDPNTHVLARISAVQVAADWEVDAAENYLALAQNKQNRLGLRLAAIAALGKTHAEEGRMQLQEWSEQDGPIGTAARAALKKIGAKNSLNN